MADVAAILLAAGFSHRMGPANKLLLEINGVALLRRTAEMLVSIPGVKVTAVLGHDADQTGEVLAGVDVQYAVNPHYVEGQRSSVFHGLSVAHEAPISMVVPADLPLLCVDDCLALLDAHGGARTSADGINGANSAAVTMPVRYRDGEMQRGNPVVLSRSARQDVVRGGVNLGCRGLIKRRPDLVNVFESDSDGFFVDIDTPKSYLDLAGQLLTTPVP